ncbi:chitinase [Kutzneria sp. CA-103260]|uniref:chitinase n=1 Tax=Kutzneria sp. CA-103260 TaxID=2802641 RepID=UPI001BA51922|nr:chitinase [Kutzneria sp. CA-103260]QUQ72327.1 chitinase [Kutzneria sp. CA-103260]
MSVRRVLALLATVAAASAVALSVPTAAATAAPQSPQASVVSEAQFNQIFPNRNKFYTYEGFTKALGSWKAFANTGDDKTKKREAAALLANVGHETGDLKYIDELNQSAWGSYCDRGQSYGCPAGQNAYHGRGPLQLSWNYNYKAAGDALHIDLLNHPDWVGTKADVAWEAGGLWFWMTQSGAGSMTAHDAMAKNKGFGETIRTINGKLECNGANRDQMQDRVNRYKKYVGILGADAGGNLTC